MRQIAAVFDAIGHLARTVAISAVALLAGIDQHALAQRVPVLGYVANENADAERAGAFKKGLTDLGYIEGRNIKIEYRYAKLDAEYHAVMLDLLAQKVDIILAANAHRRAGTAKQPTHDLQRPGIRASRRIDGPWCRSSRRLLRRS